MSKLFKKLFIKNYSDTSNPAVRTAYGVAAGILGIVFNLIIFSAKLVAGILSFSVAVIADAMNNLSDFMTSIITMFGFKISGRPADKEHPYGHARFENVTALITACIIFFIGIEVGRAGIDKIISNGKTDFSTITIIILSVSIILKLIMAFIYKGLAKDIDSDALSAMSTDSTNDVISTSVILISAIVAMITGFSLDGYLGVAVALFILISAVKLIKETIDPLIGTSPDKEFVKKIEDKLKSYPDVLDIHDLLVHNYGATKTFASVHIEVDSNVDIMISHDLADNIERDFMHDLGILLVCHLDPVNTSDPETLKLKADISALLSEFDQNVSMHDFRVVYGVSHTNVIFDVVIPFGQDGIEQRIRELVDNKLATYDKKYYAVIEFDKNFN